MTQSFALKLHSSGTSVSDDGELDARLISSLFDDIAALGDTSLASVTPFSKVQEIDRQRRYARAASLLKEWSAESSEYDEKAWKAIKPELDESGASFGEE